MLRPLRTFRHIVRAATLREGNMGWIISRYVFLTALAVMASVTTTRTASSAPIIVGKYYEENGTVGCVNNNGCTLFFTAIPAGKILQITRVSCMIVEQQNRIAFVALGQRNATNATLRRQHLKVSLTGGTAGLRRFAVNEEADLIIGPGIQPGIQIVTDLVETSSLDCQIVGRLDPPIL
jgi:hypothetical protein